MKPQKRKCSSKYRDRLSEMPDEVIVHILSYLPIVDAVRTMLIRPFGNLWTLVHTLNFNAEEVVNKLVSGDLWTGDFDNDVRKFNIFIRNVLMLHKRPVIDKFHLILDPLCDDERLVDGDGTRMWLRFALDKQAKEIYFCDFYRATVMVTDASDLPYFTSQSLVTLKLSHCWIRSQFQVNLGSLKKLILYYTGLSQDSFRQLICGCPSLQELHIVRPYSCDKYIMSFSAPNIRKLSLDFGEDSAYYDSWWLDFPNLKTLELGFVDIPNVTDASSVRDVYLKHLFVDTDDETEVGRFNLFLEKFSRSEVFQLSDIASELFLHSIDVSRLLQIRWKCLVLGLRMFCQSCLLRFYQLMRSSKHFEELTIVTDETLSDSSVAFQGSADSPPEELSYPCVMPKLKTVTLHGYAKPWKHQLQLIEFFLKSATVLEKLVIVLNKSKSTPTEQLDFVMHVSTFQRSSPSARVFFQ